MSADGLLCHCPADEAGHEPGADGCAAPRVTRGRWTRPDWRTLVESGLSPDARTALAELRARARCGATTDKGVPCSNRATQYPEMFCGVHG